MSDEEKTITIPWAEYDWLVRAVSALSDGHDLTAVVEGSKRSLRAEDNKPNWTSRQLEGHAVKMRSVREVFEGKKLGVLTEAPSTAYRRRKKERS